VAVKVIDIFGNDTMTLHQRQPYRQARARVIDIFGNDTMTLVPVNVD